MKYADSLDEAFEVSQDLIDREVKRIKSIKFNPTNLLKTCWYCEETILDNRRWCNSECRDMWELENNRN